MDSELAMIEPEEIGMENGDEFGEKSSGSHYTMDTDDDVNKSSMCIKWNLPYSDTHVPGTLSTGAASPETIKLNNMAFVAY